MYNVLKMFLMQTIYVICIKNIIKRNNKLNINDIYAHMLTYTSKTKLTTSQNVNHDIRKNVDWFFMRIFYNQTNIFLAPN